MGYQFERGFDYFRGHGRRVEADGEAAVYEGFEKFLLVFCLGVPVHPALGVAGGHLGRVQVDGGVQVFDGAFEVAALRFGGGAERVELFVHGLTAGWGWLGLILSVDIISVY